jgi:5-methylthioadenosine/S-adenosylhomocysteine deaminase
MSAYPQAPKIVIRNACLITAEPGSEPCVGHIVVGVDGKIVGVGPGEPPPTPPPGRVLDVGGKFVVPGFVSAHSHLFQSPLRGLGSDQTLFGWLGVIKQRIENATPDDLYWFCLHGAVDFLRSGITTAYDFTYSGELGGGQRSIGIGEAVVSPQVDQEPYEEVQIRAKLDAGIRFINSFSIVPLGTEQEIEERVERILKYASAHSDNPRFLKMAISGWVQRASGAESAVREARFMKIFGLMNQAHFLESPERVPEQQAKFSWYRDAGALGPSFVFGHFIHTTPQIVSETAKSGACMCWQPSANGRLGSGTADIPALRKAGIRIGIGADDQSCSDLSDPFQSLRLGLYSIRSMYKDASVLSPRDVLHFHTLGGAEILGVDSKVGSLEVGKFADFLVVDPRHPDTGPVHDPIATYVLACSLRNLKQVYIGGDLVAEGSDLVGVDEGRIRSEVDSRVARLKGSFEEPP